MYGTLINTLLGELLYVVQYELYFAKGKLLGCGESELIKGTTAMMCGTKLARCFVDFRILLAKFHLIDVVH